MIRRLALAVVLVLALTVTPTVTASASKHSPSTAELKAYAKEYVLMQVRISIKSKDGPRQWRCFERVVNYESRWNPKAENGVHYGLGQLAGSKQKHNGKPYEQVRATWKYMVHRYGDRACGALDHINWIGWY
jgi:hypothetical protein